MMLSKNLELGDMTSSETAKRLGIKNVPTQLHLENMKLWAQEIYEPLCLHFGVKIYVSSGYRSKALNAAIPGASETSQHSKGEAGDLDQDDRDGPTNAEIFEYIRENLPFDQLIWEYGTKKNPAWVHVSYSKSRRRGMVLRKDKGKPYVPYV